MTLRQYLPLVTMAFAAFVFNTSEFMPVGLLTNIADDFNVSEARAGLLISVYAWAVALLSLPLMLLVCKTEYKRLLLGVVGVFIASQAASGLATSYYALMAARIGVASAHAIFWSIAAPMAARTLPEEHRGTVIAVVATGSSIAMVVGLPLGRVIGLWLGWRMTFLAIGGISLLVFLCICLFFPTLENRGTFSVQRMPQLLNNRVLMGIYLATMLLATALYTGYGYIEPFLGQVARMSEDTVTLTLIIYGASGLLGSLVFSRVYGHNRCRFIALSCGGMSAVLLLLHGASLAALTMVALCVCWGMISTAFNVAFQDCIIRYSASDAAAVATSIYSGIFNLGIGTGAFVGGLVCTYSHIAYIGYAGGLIAALSWGYIMLRLLPNMQHADKHGY